MIADDHHEVSKSYRNSEVSTMNSTQNKKLEQVKETTLIVGIDVGGETHYARAFDWREFEYSKNPFRFKNTEQGFIDFVLWIQEISEKQGKTEVISGMEPTGHYWFNLGLFLNDKSITKKLTVSMGYMKLHAGGNVYTCKQASGSYPAFKDPDWITANRTVSKTVASGKLGGESYATLGVAIAGGVNHPSHTAKWTGIAK